MEMEETPSRMEIWAEQVSEWQDIMASYDTDKTYLQEINVLMTAEISTRMEINNMELLDNARVKAELLCLELGEDSAAEVDSHDVE